MGMNNLPQGKWQINLKCYIVKLKINHMLLLIFFLLHKVSVVQ